MAQINFNLFSYSTFLKSRHALTALNVFVASFLIVLFSAGQIYAANVRYQVQTYKKNPKLGELLNKENFQFNLSLDEAMKVYKLDKKTIKKKSTLLSSTKSESLQDGRVVSLGFSQVEYHSSRGLTDIEKVISLDKKEVNTGTYFDDFASKYGTPATREVSGRSNYLIYNILHKGRYLQFWCYLETVQKINSTRISYWLSDYTHSVEKQKK